MTARELGERMDSEELHAWIEYDSINRDDSWYQAAMISAAAHWAMGIKGVRIEDFLPPARTFDAEVPAPDIEAQLIPWAIAHNARIQANSEVQQAP